MDEIESTIRQEFLGSKGGFHADVITKQLAMKKIFKILSIRGISTDEYIFWCDLLECIGHYGSYNCEWSKIQKFTRTVFLIVCYWKPLVKDFNVKHFAREYFSSG